MNAKPIGGLVGSWKLILRAWVWLDARNYPMCENTSARDCHSINVSQRTLLVARSVAGKSYFGRLRKILLAASQIFAFLHSQGQSQHTQRTPKSIDVRSCSFDQLVGQGKHRGRHGEAERFGSLEINDKLELGRLIEGDVTGIGTL